jgi:DNA-binding CsgD family transcriptional regulator
MKASGYSTAEIAKNMSISSSTVSKYIKGKE